MTCDRRFTGHTHSVKTRQQMSDSQTGRMASARTRRRMSESVKVKTFSQEHRANIGKAERGRKQSPEHVQKRLSSRRAHGWFKDIEATKKRMSASLTGKHATRGTTGMQLIDLHGKRCKCAVCRHRGVYQNTKIEQKIAKLLISQNIKFIRQKRISNLTRVDFYIASRKLIIECDGCYWHDCPTHFPDRTLEFAKTIAKTKILTDSGYEVRRLWEHDINKMTTIIV